MTDLVGRVGWVSEQGHMLPRQHGTLSCVERDPLVDRNPEREKETERETHQLVSLVTHLKNGAFV